MSTSKSAAKFPVNAWLLAGFLSWGLTACQTSPPPAPAPAPVPAPVPAGAIPAGAREYRVIPEESLLQILVYRGGPMARLGHNHVIASHQVTGAVYVTDDPLATRFEVSIPVNDLTVDEPALREQAGADFPASVPQSARDGTRGNLLSAALLDGAQFPQIRLRATDVVANGESYDVGVEITLKGATHLVRVPVDVQRQEGALTARGEFALKQSDLGLKPFSIAMGSLVVLDEIRVRFALTAREKGLK